MQTYSLTIAVFHIYKH